MKAMVWLAVALAVAAGVAGFQVPAEGSHIPVTITARDFSFEVPSKVPSGWVTFRLVNRGAEPHHAQVMRLKPGVTYAQIEATLRKGPAGEAEFLRMVAFVGGPGTILPGAQGNLVTARLTPGQYLLMCFVPSPDGKPHFAKGMIKGFTVPGPMISSAAPRARATITLKDFFFSVPTGFRGRGTYAVANRGVQPHELDLWRMAPGKTADDLKAFFSGKAPPGPPPGMPASGAQALDGGAVSYIQFNLQPGTYVAVCNVPDPGSHKPHWQLGMITSFTIK